MVELHASVTDVAAMRRVCGRCRLRNLCLPPVLSDADVLKVRRSVLHIGPLEAGEYLFRAGDRFRAIYAVRSGCLETCRSTRSGRKDVVRFHMVGELLGLDAIYTQTHSCDAVALETSRACALPYHSLMRLAWDRPTLHEELIRLMSQQIADEVSLAAGHDARQRIAHFLLDVMKRHEEHGDRYDQLVLPMSREDIASRLGLATETVSRTITRLQAEGIIEVHRKCLRLMNAARLTEIAEG